MREVLYFDVEWANSKNKSICQMGLMSEDFDTQDPIYPELELLINPNDDFEMHCVSTHHITKEKVKDCETFDKVWEVICKYFVKSVVIGHNVKSADLDALVKNLKRYNIDIPEMYCLDTYELARDLIPATLIKDYSLETLCSYYGIDIDNAHNAFDDACACADLLRAIINDYQIDIDDYIEKYIEKDVKSFSRYINSPTMRREINQLFGNVLGIEMDNRIKPQEKDYLIKWKEEHETYRQENDVKEIFNVLDKILEDNIVTNTELNLLRFTLSNYVHSLEGAIETLATQQLQGILEGVIVDEEINDKEIDSLSNWLYNNDYLEGHYPYDSLIKIIKEVLEDKVITKEEQDLLKKEFKRLFNPLNEIKNQIIVFNNSSFCLSGTFVHGDKKIVKDYIVSKGGIIQDNVKKGTNYVVVGDLGCDAYSNVSFGTKVKKALELGITVVKEKDIYE